LGDLIGRGLVELLDLAWGHVLALAPADDVEVVLQNLFQRAGRDDFHRILGGGRSMHRRPGAPDCYRERRADAQATAQPCAIGAAYQTASWNRKKHAMVRNPAVGCGLAPAGSRYCAVARSVGDA